MRRRKASDSALNLNTSESRIRSWQQFYGAIESTSTASSISLKSMDKDFNSNKKRKKKTSFSVPSPPVTGNGLDPFEQGNSTMQSSESRYETVNILIKEIINLLGIEHLVWMIETETTEDEKQSESLCRDYVFVLTQTIKKRSYVNLRNQHIHL